MLPDFSIYGHQILEEFSNLNITITPIQIRNTLQLVTKFELRDAHPLTLNSQVFGVYPIVFKDSDKHDLFNIFKIQEHTLQAMIDNILAFNYAEPAVKGGRYIKTEFKVAANPFNVFCIWLIHLGLTTIRNKKDRDVFCLSVAKYLHYRFFTSLIGRLLQYGADEEVMQAVINDLSRKFDIITKGTWRKDIEERCLDLISEKSIHYKTLLTPDNDVAFRYILSDTQTRMRTKLVTICKRYYNDHKEGNRIKSKSSTGVDEEGNVYVIERSSVYDSMVSSLITALPNTNMFVNVVDVRKVSSRFSNIRDDLLRNALVYMSTKASQQMRSNDLDNITINKDGTTVFHGMKILVSSIIQISFNYTTNQNINLKQKALLWRTLQNVYSSSRSLDVNIQNVKNSVAVLVDEMDYTTRESTKATLRLAIIMYIIFEAMRSL